MNLATGIYDGISATDYRSKIQAVSNSYLSRLDRCPAAAKVPQADSPAFAFGSAFHTLVLEEMKFGDEFAVYPSYDKRTKEGKERFAEFQGNAEGKEIIMEADYETLLEMRTAVYSHPFAKQILAEGISEQTVIFTEPTSNIRCKCRPDRVPSNGGGVIIDLKTTTDASEYGFGRSMVKYNYCNQAAFYVDGYNSATGADVDAFIFVAVEKTAPYRVATYLIDGDFLQYGRENYQALLSIEAICREKNHWPNYLSGELETIFKPGYL